MASAAAMPLSPFFIYRKLSKFIESTAAGTRPLEQIGDDDIAAPRTDDTTRCNPKVDN
jgi:hypothetical protein